MRRGVCWVLCVVGVLGVSAARAVARTSVDLYAFGANFYGQLGNSTNNQSYTLIPRPERVSLPGATGPVVQAAAGSDYSLGVTSTGQLYGFGFNGFGPLGNSINNNFDSGGPGTPPAPPNPSPNPTPALVSLPGATGPVVQASAGEYHSLAVTSTGQLYAFGDNFSGELASATNNDTRAPNPTPASVSLPGATGPVARVAAGWGFSLAVTSTGQLYAFGDNKWGELGSATNDGTIDPNPTPTLVSLRGATGPVVQVSAGVAHSLAVTSTGQLYAFGDNQWGQLGNATNNGTENPNPTPTLVSLPGATGPVIQAAAGADYSLAVTSTGQLFAFGNNFFGNLGNATNNGINVANPTPTLVSLPGAAGPVLQVAAGSPAGGSLAVTSSGQLYAFGYNGYGAMGSATNTFTLNANPTPALVGLPDGERVDIVAPGSGDDHSLVLAFDQSLSRTFPLTTLTVSPRRLSLAGRTAHGRCEPATLEDHGASSCRRPLRLRVQFALLRTPATLRVSLARITTGRHVNGRCLKPSQANKTHRSCPRPIPVGNAHKWTAHGGARMITITFAGLAPADYQLIVTPSIAGHTSTPKKAAISITG